MKVLRTEDEDDRTFDMIEMYIALMTVWDLNVVGYFSIVTEDAIDCIL